LEATYSRGNFNPKDLNMTLSREKLMISLDKRGLLNSTLLYFILFAAIALIMLLVWSVIKANLFPR